MKYRHATLYPSENASTAKTEAISLDMKDIISRIQIKFNATNVTNDPVAHPAAAVSKVEIVDGSEVLYSLSAREIESLMFYNTGKSRARHIDYRGGNENHMILDMMFGTKLFDPLLAFDPTKFSNPKLMITHNKASGLGTPTAATLEVFADLFDEKVPSPIGYIMPKEYFAYTTPSAASNEYIDLPDDYPIKRIMVSTFKAGAWWDNIITEIELNEESGKRKPWEEDAYDIMMTALTKYGPYTEFFTGILSSQTANLFYITPEEEASVAPCGMGFTGVYSAGNTSGCQVNLKADNSVEFRALVSGPMPHGAVPLDCGDQMDPEDWLDVTTKGKIKLRVKAGGTNPVNVVLEQLRKY